MRVDGYYKRMVARRLAGKIIACIAPDGSFKIKMEMDAEKMLTVFRGGDMSSAKGVLSQA